MRHRHSGSNPNIALASEEIQKISQFIRQAFNPFQFRRSEPFDDLEPVNDPELVILPIDPFHLHAYWRIPDPNAFVRDNGTPLMLRLFWKLNRTQDFDTGFSWVDIAEVTEQDQTIITLPATDATYTVAIGQRDDSGGFRAYVQSQSIMMPALVSASPVTEFMLAEASSAPCESDADGTFIREMHYFNDKTAFAPTEHPQPASNPLATVWAILNEFGNYSSAAAFRLQCAKNNQ